jgi:rRNA processing protein Krr1/Pno1
MDELKKYIETKYEYVRESALDGLKNYIENLYEVKVHIEENSMTVTGEMEKVHKAQKEIHFILNYSKKKP